MNLIGSFSSSTGTAIKKITYTSIVEAWSEERELLKIVQAYTARKARQKALLFEPWLSAGTVDEITPQGITEALMVLGSTGGRTGHGLSSATLRAAHLAGTQALDWAIAKGLVTSNPFNQTHRPKANYRMSQFLTSRQASELTSQMVGLLHNSIRKGKVKHVSYALAVCIAIATGLRRGEIFALTWSDIDMTNKRLGVSKAVKADGHVGRPKSRSGIRSVAIGLGLTALLDEVYYWMESTEDINSKHPIISDSEGNIASLDSFSHWWRRWADNHGWDGLRFHELRHTHATLLIASGVDVKTVQMRLGHSSADITMSCYAHALPFSDGAAPVLLDASLSSQ